MTEAVVIVYVFGGILFGAAADSLVSDELAKGDAGFALFTKVG